VKTPLLARLNLAKKEMLRITAMRRGSYFVCFYLNWVSTAACFVENQSMELWLRKASLRETGLPVSHDKD
jgi:hypothetical protein